jgi:hypothetical protein
MSFARATAALALLSLVPACGGDPDPPSTVCEPFDAPTPAPAALALDATRIYWTDLGATSGQGAIYSAPKDCGPKTAIAAHQNDPVALAVDASSVYWLNRDAVMKAPLGGGSAVKLADVTDEVVDGDVVLDADHVYVATGARILRIPKAGGAAEELATAFSALALAVDETYVHYCDQGGDVARVPKAGGSPEIIAQDQHGLGIAASADHLYWLAIGRSGDGQILGMPKSGGDGVYLGDARIASRLHFDGERIYASIAGELLSVDVRTGAVATLYSEDGDPVRFVTDDTQVYWIVAEESDDGSERPKLSVWRDAKPSGGAPVFTSGTGSVVAAWTVDRRPECLPGSQVSLVLLGPTPAAAVVPCDALGHTFTGLGSGSYILSLRMLGGAAFIGFETKSFPVDAGAFTLPVIDLGPCTLKSCTKDSVGCVNDGVCTPEDDCTCPDCAQDFVCNPGGAGCPTDGVCSAYYEGCSCPDCAGTPACM